MALALPSTASATVPLGYVQLSGSNLQDSTGTLLANATISFAPVNNAGQPISYQVNGHGQAMFIPVYALVTNLDPPGRLELALRGGDIIAGGRGVRRNGRGRPDRFGLDGRMEQFDGLRGQQWGQLQRLIVYCRCLQH